MILTIIQAHLDWHPADQSARAQLADMLADDGEYFLAAVHKLLARKTPEALHQQRYLHWNYRTADAVVAYKSGAGSLPGEADVVAWGRHERITSMEVCGDWRWIQLTTMGKPLPHLDELGQEYTIPGEWFVPLALGVQVVEGGHLWAEPGTLTRRVPVFTAREAVQVEDFYYEESI